MVSGPAASQPRTLGEMIRMRCPPAAPFIDAPDGRRMSYADADRASARFANALVAHGVEPGHRVVVCLEKSPLAVLVYLAIIRAGAVFVPLNPAYTDAELAYLLSDAAPSLVVCDPGRADVAAAAHLRTLTASADGAGELDAAAGMQDDRFDDIDREPEDLAAILYTSGTTGRPKGAMLSQGNLTSNALTLQRAWGFEGADVVLHALPLFHAHGLFVALNCVLASGASMVLLGRFDVDAVLEHLPRSTVFMGVPTFYERLLGDPRLDAQRCGGVRLFVSGSAPLPASTHARFQARTGHAILERYGMTETVMLTSNPLNGERRAGTVGRPLPGVALRITEDSTRRPLGADRVGHIEVRGPNVFSGYWRHPERPMAEFTEDGWFRTGDLGRLDADGYLELVGRAKDLVISGGMNVYPKEVEEVLDSLDAVQESAVVGIPDPDLGEAVIAVIVVRPGCEIDESVVRAALRQRLAGFKVPKEIHTVEALPRNAMAKVDKALLRSRFAG